MLTVIICATIMVVISAIMLGTLFDMMTNKSYVGPSLLAILKVGGISFLAGCIIFDYEINVPKSTFTAKVSIENRTAFVYGPYGKVDLSDKLKKNFIDGEEVTISYTDENYHGTYGICWPGYADYNLVEEK